VVISTSVTTIILSILAIIGTVITNKIQTQETLPSDYIAAISMVSLFTIPLFSFLAVKLQQMHLLNEQLHNLATTDFLTGALSRGAFVVNVETRLYDRFTAGLAPNAALLVIDVDHFKRINDRFGHQTGDLALVRIADTLGANLRETDLFGRLGGEEFGIYLEDVSPDDAIRTAERCRKAINRLGFTPEGEDHPLSISIGVAFSGPDMDFTALFKQADSCLYLAKACGRNRTEFAEEPRAA